MPLTRGEEVFGNWHMLICYQVSLSRDARLYRLRKGH